jgi:hypothetical protein
MSQETEAETKKALYERAEPPIAPLAKIGAQLERLNRNLEALAHVLEKRAAGGRPFRGPHEERRPPWKQPRRRWQPRRAEGAPPVGRQEPGTSEFQGRPGRRRDRDR